MGRKKVVMNKVRKPLGIRSLVGAHPIVGRYLLYRALFGGPAFLVPVLLVLYKKCHLETSEIVLLQAYFSLALAILSILGGYFADLFNRKTGLILGLVAFGVGEILYGTARSFGGLLIAELTIAIALALITGAERALLYHSLGERAKELFAQVYSAGFMVWYISMACYSLSSAVIAGYALWPLSVLAAGSLFLAVPVIAGLEEPSRSQRAAEGGHIRALLRIGTEAFGRRSILRWELVFAGLMIAAARASFPLMQPYYAECEIEPSVFGVIAGVSCVLSAVYMHYYNTISGWLGKAGVEMAVPGAAGAACILLGAFPSVYSLLFLILLVWVQGFADVAFSDSLNAAIGETDRATLNSLLVTVWRGVLAVALWGLTVVLKTSTPSTGLLFIGIVAITTGWSLLVLRRVCS
jgi:MFS family permease